jgi:hypothetical protein
MDPGALVPEVRQLLPDGGNLLAALASLTAASVFGSVTLRTRRRRRVRRAWQHAGEAMGLMLAHRREKGSRLSKRPFLCGVYRGRAVEAGLTGVGQVRIAVRIANPLHLFDELRASAATATVTDLEAAWLTDAGRDGLIDLRANGQRRWSVTVRDHLLTLIVSSPALAGGDPIRLRALTDLACDLAEGVDRVTSPGQTRVKTHV